MNQIDHIVYAVHDLKKACGEIKRLTGVEPKIGGRHIQKGTKNALLYIGKKCYLELLSIDTENKKISAPRWMGIDYLKEPKITRWAFSSREIEAKSKTLKTIDLEMGEIIAGERITADGKKLNWQMTKPLSSPEVEVIPFMIDWSESAHHPADSLEKKCNLIAFEIYHPQPETIRSLFKKLTIKLEVKKSHQPRLAAIIEAPKGIIKL